MSTLNKIQTCPDTAPHIPLHSQPSHLQDILNTIHYHRQQLLTIHYTIPTITILNFQLLQHKNNPLWKSYVYTLLQNTHIPTFWILHVIPEHSNDTFPNTVFIQPISYQVKDLLCQRLNQLHLPVGVHIY